MEQPAQTSQAEEPPTVSQGTEASDGAEEQATTAEQDPGLGTTEETAAPQTESAATPADPVATVNSTVNSTVNRTMEQVAKGTKVVKAGVKTVTKAAQAFDDLLKAFDPEPATEEQATEPR
ncbi:MAG: hypothetical protein UZ07_CHB004000499 [Chlorobi bacterium OLB7]|nr:MAG: hypothetical protein UZ07_CHB004000499 [Chlorobi bacterium OLB7]